MWRAVALVGKRFHTLSQPMAADYIKKRLAKEGQAEIIQNY